VTQDPVVLTDVDKPIPFDLRRVLDLLDRYKDSHHRQAATLRKEADGHRDDYDESESGRLHAKAQCHAGFAGDLVCIARRLWEEAKRKQQPVYAAPTVELVEKEAP